MPDRPDRSEREWLRMDEVAKDYGADLRTVRRLVQKGHLPAHRIAGTRLVRIHRDDARKALEPVTPGAKKP